MAFATEQGKAYGLTDAKILIVEAAAIVAIDVLYANEATMDPQVTTLTFEGDQTSDELDLLTRVNVTLTTHKLDLIALTRIFGKNVVTGITGLDWRTYFGNDAEQSGVPAGLQLSYVFRDEVTGTAETLKYHFFKGTLKAFRPQTLGYNARHALGFNFTFPKVTTDLLAAALTSVPADGAIFGLEKVT